MRHQCLGCAPGHAGHVGPGTSRFEGGWRGSKLYPGAEQQAGGSEQQVAASDGGFRTSAGVEGKSAHAAANTSDLIWPRANDLAAGGRLELCVASGVVPVVVRVEDKVQLPAPVSGRCRALSSMHLVT